MGGYKEKHAKTCITDSMVELMSTYGIGKFPSVLLRMIADFAVPPLDINIADEKGYTFLALAQSCCKNHLDKFGHADKGYHEWKNIVSKMEQLSEPVNIKRKKRHINRKKKNRKTFFG